MAKNYYYQIQIEINKNNYIYILNSTFIIFVWDVVSLKMENH